MWFVGRMYEHGQISGIALVMPRNLSDCFDLSVAICDVAFVCSSWAGDFILHLAGIDDKRVYLEHALEEAERQYQDGDEGDVSLLDRSQQQDSGAEYDVRQRQKDVRLLKSSGIRGADDLTAASLKTNTYCVKDRALSDHIHSVLLQHKAFLCCFGHKRTQVLYAIAVVCPSRAHGNSPCCAGG